MIAAAAIESQNHREEGRGDRGDQAKR